jgi:hypothetical protein
MVNVLPEPEVAIVAAVHLDRVDVNGLLPRAESNQKALHCSAF